MPPIDPEALRLLLELKHPSPHDILGCHPEGDRLIVRVLRPDAVSVEVDDDHERALLTPSRSVPWFFEGSLSGGKARPYELRIHHADGTVTEEWDPYSFLPTLGELDAHLFNEGTHRRLWEILGARPMVHGNVEGTAFSVWAPSAAGASVVGDWNGWDGRRHPMRKVGATGVWELFLPGVGEGARYKFELRGAEGPPYLKADPMARRTEVPPLNASVVHALDGFHWTDGGWMASRADDGARPVSIYEVHLGSWRRVPEEANRPLTYRELAPLLAAHVKSLGFTHVELMPVAEHPYSGSWGYQVTSYFAPTARFGTPDDFRYLVDTLHQHGIGVLVDWVPAHFPRDTWALARFDGTALYEHDDPRRGEHPDWGTLIFNLSRLEVKNFLVANALFWLEQYHVDGLRVDAVASMLYRDYSRREGEWVPGPHGGRENEEAVHFLREVGEAVQAHGRGALLVAEESTAWPQVSHPPSQGGLGFTHKWNMGWMHDTLKYFSTDPIYRRHHHHQLTFGFLYAWTERFVLPLSHDEVVHGKRSLLSKMPGDDWQRLANLRALLAWMWAHPGKKLLFMGAEFGQWNEWNAEGSLDWHLLSQPRHLGLQRLVNELNGALKREPALHRHDFDERGFQWLQPDAAEENVYAFLRKAGDDRPVLCLANLSPVVRERWRVGVPGWKSWRVLLNTDDERFGGSGVWPGSGALPTLEQPWDRQPVCLEVTLPPLAVSYLVPRD